jgi:DnaJ-class molecular chaperone
MRREDALEILGVAHDADDRTITRAFRSLAQKHHPGAFPLACRGRFLRRFVHENEI